MKCKDLITKLLEVSPAMYSLEWDNSGLLVGDEEQEINKVLLSVDVTEEVVEEAIRVGADMILAHHPLIFSKINKVVASDFLGKRIIKMIQNNICCYCMHTNFDVMGMADAAADELGLLHSEVLMVTYEDDISREGIGRCGKLSEAVSLEECGENIKRVFGLESVKIFGDGEKIVEKAAICPGSGKSVIEKAVQMGADVLITGDIDHHTGLDAVAEGLAIIDAGHYGIEHIFIKLFTLIGTK